MLRQHVQSADPGLRGILRGGLDGLEAAWHSIASNRLVGTSNACEGSSMRWLERPMRWISRLAPFGAPRLMTRSTSPQSCRDRAWRCRHRLQPPLRHRRLDLAALACIQRSMMQRDRQVVVVQRPEFWNTNSACMRVLTKTRLSRCARIAA